MVVKILFRVTQHECSRQFTICPQKCSLPQLPFRRPSQTLPHLQPLQEGSRAQSWVLLLFCSICTLGHTALLLKLDCSRLINEGQVYLSSSQIVYNWVSWIMFCHCGRHLELNTPSQLKCHSHLSLLLKSVYCRVSTHEVLRDFLKHILQFSPHLSTAGHFWHYSSLKSNLHLFHFYFIKNHLFSPWTPCFSLTILLKFWGLCPLSLKHLSVAVVTAFRKLRFILSSSSLCVSCNAAYGQIN